MKKLWLLAFILCASLSLPGCSWLGLSDDEDKTSDSSDNSPDSSSDSAPDKPAGIPDDKKDRDWGGNHPPGMPSPKNVDEAAAQRALLPICPQVAIVRDLDDIRDYGGDTPDVSALVAGAKLLSVDGTCEYTDTGIDVHFALNMVAARGARLGGRHTSFPFFVAVVDPAGNILNKELMTADFSFSGDERTANDAETLHVFVPLPYAKRGIGPDYRVLMGFQKPAAPPPAYALPPTPTK